MGLPGPVRVRTPGGLRLLPTMSTVAGTLSPRLTTAAATAAMPIATPAAANPIAVSHSVKPHSAVVTRPVKGTSGKTPPSTSIAWLSNRPAAYRSCA